MRREDVLEDLLALAAPSSDAPVRTVAVGSHYTAVIGRGAGLAATARGASWMGEPGAPWRGRLDGLPARRLLAFLGSSRPMERTIGLATLNSLIGTPSDAVPVADGHSLVLELARGRHAALVGRFRFAAALRGVAASLRVLELDPRDGEDPASAAPAVLAGAEVVAVTATTLVNGTFDALVPSFAPAATVVMLGPTTPMSPVLFDHRVDVLAGVMVHDPDALVRAVSRGASRHQLQGTRQVVIARTRALAERAERAGRTPVSLHSSAGSRRSDPHRSP